MKRLILISILVIISTPTLAIQNCEICDQIVRIAEIAKRGTRNLEAEIKESELIHTSGLKAFYDETSPFIGAIKYGNCGQDNFNSFETVIAARITLIRKLIELNAQIAKMGEGIIKSQSWVYGYSLTEDQTHALRTFAVTQSNSVQQTNRHVNEYTAAIHALRLTFADAALAGNCLDIADTEFRAVLKSGGPQFTAQALVGIQDVRDRRRR